MSTHCIPGPCKPLLPFEAGLVILGGGWCGDGVGGTIVARGGGGGPWVWLCVLEYWLQPQGSSWEDWAPL